LVGHDRTTNGVDACGDRNDCKRVEQHVEVRCQPEPGCGDLE
jgi:hypothetical protein